MCNLSWTPHSNLEKDNSLKTTPVLAQRWAVWSILTKNFSSLCYAHKRVLTIMKVYIKKNNLQLEVLWYRKKAFVTCLFTLGSYYAMHINASI